MLQLVIHFGPVGTLVAGVVSSATARIPGREGNASTWGGDFGRKCKWPRLRLLGASRGREVLHTGGPGPRSSEAHAKRGSRPESLGQHLAPGSTFRSLATAQRSAFTPVTA